MSNPKRIATVYISAKTVKSGAIWSLSFHAEGREPVNKRRTLPDITQPQACLHAAIDVLEGVKDGAQLTLVCDVNYLTLGISRDLQKWMTNGWKKSDGRRPANVDLWKRLHAALTRHDVIARRTESDEERQLIDSLGQSERVAA